MRNNITNRDNFFLGKVAGRDIDISTLTPPVPTSMREKLLLEIADRLDNGGGAPTLEVVAEIEVGIMDYVSEAGMYLYELSEEIELPTDRQLYFNSEDYPLAYSDGFWSYNVDYDTQTITPPAFMVTSGTDQSVGSTSNLSNTTVKILAKASSGVGKFIVTLSQENDTWTADKDVEDIVAAYNDGQVVCARFPRMLGEIETILEAQCIVANSVQTESTPIYVAVFSVIVELEHGTCACYTVSGVIAQEGEEKQVSWEVSTTELSGGSSGGGNISIAEYRNRNEQITCSMTFDQIIGVLGEDPSNSGFVFAYYDSKIYYYDSVNEGQIIWKNVNVRDDYANELRIIHSDDDTIVFGEFSPTIPSVIVVTYTVTENEGVVSATCDKEYLDITSAIANGKSIIFKFTGTFIAQTSVYIIGDSSIVITIPVIDGEGGSPVAYGIVHDSDDTIRPVMPS